MLNPQLYKQNLLKAMKLSAWSIDAKTHKITYGEDYRDHLDNFIPAVNTDYDSSIELIHPDDAKRVHCALDALCSGKMDSYHEQYRVIVPQLKNKFYWAESYAVVSESDDEGKPATVVGTTMRIDRRKKMEAALIDARNKAEEANRLKSAFLANMSHEIRTPLNSMSGYAQILLSSSVSEEERNECLKRIIENSETLASLLNSLIEISDIEAGKNEVRRIPLDLNLMITNLAHTYIKNNVDSEVRLTTYIPDRECVIVSDQNSLKTICGHLLDNAYKFTTHGSIVIGYNKLRTSRVRIWVQDTGVGIPSNQREHIFDSFVKLDEFAAGAGLGLALCKNITYNLGGTIGVESEVGQGSTFWIEIPIS